MTSALTDKDPLDRFTQIVEDLLLKARQLGASAAEAGVSSERGLSVTVRLGEVETVERTSDHGLGITVYFGHRKGTASTTDMSAQALDDTVAAACRIARYASEDPYAGLPPEDRLAKDYPNLALYFPWPLNIDEATQLALRCESAARDFDPRIENSEGATVGTMVGQFVYGNSLGFVGGYPSSRHSVSCAVVAREGDSMQRDYWYTNARDPMDLEDSVSVGQRAAQRALDRLGSRKIGTCRVPVLFRADVAPALLRSLIGAIRGPALYRNASFLLDHLGKRIFPDWVRIHEQPHLLKGLASAPFDNEGVATQERDLVKDGVLQGYVLDSYAARKLKLETTGNAGGVRNLTIEGNPDAKDFQGLVSTMDQGLVVTELMGQGANLVTGDYSRGAAGFWVDGGRIVHPVEEITVAGNLEEMFRDLAAVGTDNRLPGSIKTGSWLIEKMTVAGN